MRTTHLQPERSPGGGRSETRAGAGRSRRFPPWLAALLLLLLAAPAVLAQSSGSATLRGTVKDPQGDVIEGATVTLTSETTGQSRTTESKDAGVYVFAQVESDVYTLKVEAPNFRSYQQTGLRLAPSDTRGQDVQLEIGITSEVTIVATEEQIKTETGEKSTTITAQQIESLSLVGRSSLELLRILPGVVAPDQDALEVTGFNAGANANAAYSVNGLRGVSNSVSIDGSRVIDIGSNNGTIITANNDMVEEVKVQTSNFLAEYGSAAVQISAVTKSGGQDYHGSLYWYTRPGWASATDRARNYAGFDKPASRYNYPGGNIGGPVPLGGYNKDRDKLFFFFGLEFQRQLQPAEARLGVVPTLAQRQGDFSELLAGGLLNQPAQVLIPSGFDGAGSPAPGNNLAPYIDPIGRALINLYPLPNFNDPSGRYNYVTNTLADINRIDAKLRVDWKPTDATSVYVRLARESERLEYFYGIWWNASAFELPTPVEGDNLGRSAAVGVTTVISPTMVNEVVFSASKLKLDNDYQDPTKVTREALGLTGLTLPFGVQTPYAPIAIHSWGGRPGGDFWSPGGLPLFAYNASYSVNDTLSKVWGSHTLKFGGLIEAADKTQNFHNGPEGRIVLGSGWIPGSTGNDYGDLLVGRPASMLQETAPPRADFRHWNIEGFAQDSWKVRPNLTLEYGVRISYFTNPTERNNLGAIFSPDAYVRGAGPFVNGDPTEPNGVLLAARGEIPKEVVPHPPVKFGPRVGFAWDITGEAKTVLRGGVGVFYTRPQGNYYYEAIRLPPNAYATGVDAWGYSGLTYSNFGDLDPYSRLAGFSPRSLDPNISDEFPRVTSTSLSLAQRVFFDTVVEASYVGTFGRQLPYIRSINAIPMGGLTGVINGADLSDPRVRAAASGQPSVTNLFRPFPDFNDVTLMGFGTDSDYNALQITASRQEAKHVQYFLAYTWSKALGHQALNETGDVVDPFDPRGRNYGYVGTDRRHIFNASYVIQIPDLSEGWAENWFGRGALSGWKISGITNIQSGRPLRINVTGAFNSPATRAAYTGSPNGSLGLVFLSDPRVSKAVNRGNVGNYLLSASAIALPGFGDIGTFQSPYDLRGPTRSNTDLTFFKTFGITESQRLEFRAGIFNVFNQAYPNPDLGDIDLNLNTECNRMLPAGIPNGTGGMTDSPMCDPTGGFRITNASNFGRVNTKHGRRIVEFAVKYLF